ncbi:flavin-containing monooxygenase [Mycobacterium bourgelatii]|uniref:Monooxygenase n=1 Tax=Mycobacterium bourgelatii TaxID=1273442 RepID=A0A7I9YPC7_MYCBU|nr:NAD(P)/FAD-dependent oxidoreductase [Mycobacterium bourgelatii]MCV6975071.1 NAD(P)/FAD-dependent oxidoreductase [Mycobacterium bourgelatii]GFG90477.1 monooxygenase [Mycobacterium bourgelatii]
MSCEPTHLPDPDQLDIPALREKYREERDRRLRPDGQEQYAPAVEGEQALDYSDPHMPRQDREALTDDVDVAILGGGWAGILAGYHMRRAGVENFRIIEQAGDFGGVWYWNRYPGLSCDNDSYCYLPLLEEMNFFPSKKFADGFEIREYCQSIATKFDLYQGALFHTCVNDLTWDESIRRWHVRTDRGDDIRARFVVIALGPINRPKVPRVAGLEEFEGKIFHTARWDYEYTGGNQREPVLDKLRDKSVAIVGTGASAIQAVPYLGKYAKQLYVLQRTASTVDERHNTPTDPAWLATLQPGWQRERQMNFHRAAIDGLMPGEPDHICDIWTELNRNLAAEFDRVGWPQSPEDFLAKREQMDYRIMERLRARVDAVVKDKKTAEILKPWYRHMCKRPASSDEFYPTFNRPNVKLLDVSSTRGIERITRRGFIHESTEYEIDLLIFASGFEVTSDLQRRWAIDKISGREGRSLYDNWAREFRTLHGVMAHGFPNQFYIGFFQGGFNASTTETFNNQGRHIAWIVSEALKRGATSVEPSQEAQDAYVKHVREVAIDTSDFFRECTPGYFNNDGQEIPDESGELRPRTYTGELYGLGYYAFEKLLEDWRSNEDLAGLEIES